MLVNCLSSLLQDLFDFSCIPFFMHLTVGQGDASHKNLPCTTFWVGLGFKCAMMAVAQSPGVLPLAVLFQHPNATWFCNIKLIFKMELRVLESDTRQKSHPTSRTATRTATGTVQGKAMPLVRRELINGGIQSQNKRHPAYPSSRESQNPSGQRNQSQRKM